MKPRHFLILLLFFLFHSILEGQNEKQILRNLVKGDSAALRALVLYPESTRLAILEAASHPEIIARMQIVQEETSTSFRELISEYPRETQEKIWNLSRFPSLIEKLAQGGLKKKKELEQIAADYPEEVRSAALELGNSEHKMLGRISQLNKSSEIALHEIVKEYPEETRKKIKELEKNPEVISILGKNMGMTVLVGDLYRRKPSTVKHTLDSLSREIEKAQTQEVEEWKQNLEKDPQALEELKQSAEKFAEEQGYEKDEYPSESVVHAKHTWYPYTYWFGYPWWYEWDYWYPYPLWYHSGFYYGPGNVLVFTGLPSYYFMHWHFTHPQHFYYYPNLSNRYVSYYYGPRKSPGNGYHSAVKKWIRDSSPRLPAGWMKDDGKRSERFRELGKTAMDSETNRPNPEQGPRAEGRKPIQIASPEKPQAPDKPSEPNRYQIRQPEKDQQMNNASDYHKDTWNQPREQRRPEAAPPARSNPAPVRPVPAPTPRHQPQPAKEPARPAPRRN